MHDSKSSPFYEDLEFLAFSHKPCEIVFVNDLGSRTAVRDRVLRLFEKEGEGWLLMYSGLQVRVDKIVELNHAAPGAPS